MTGYDYDAAMAAANAELAAEALVPDAAYAAARARALALYADALASAVTDAEVGQARAWLAWREKGAAAAHQAALADARGAWHDAYYAAGAAYNRSADAD